MLRRIAFLCQLVLAGCGNEQMQPVVGEEPLDAAKIAVSPGPIYSFPSLTVGNSTTAVFTLTNGGTLDAESVAATFYLSRTFTFDGGFPGTGGDCGATLSGGASCDVVVTFSPQTAGDNEQTLAVSYFNGYSTKRTDLPLLRGRGL